MIKERIRRTSEGAEDPTLPFLDLVVCPSFEVAYKMDVLQKYGMQHRDYVYNGYFYPTQNNDNQYDPRIIVSNYLLNARNASFRFNSIYT